MPRLRALGSVSLPVGGHSHSPWGVSEPILARPERVPREGTRSIDGGFVSPGPAAVGAPGGLGALPAQPWGQNGRGPLGGLAPGVDSPGLSGLQQQGLRPQACVRHCVLGPALPGGLNPESNSSPGVPHPDGAASSRLLGPLRCWRSISWEGLCPRGGGRAGTAEAGVNRGACSPLLPLRCCLCAWSGVGRRWGLTPSPIVTRSGPPPGAAAGRPRRCCTCFAGGAWTPLLRKPPR